MNTSSQNVNTATTQWDPLPKTHRADKQEITLQLTPIFYINNDPLFV